MKLIRDEWMYVPRSIAFNFITWLYWRWDRIFGMGLPKRREKGFRLFGFTHIREWLMDQLEVEK